MRILGPPSQPADGTEAGWGGGPKIRICVTPAILLKSNLKLKLVKLGASGLFCYLFLQMHIGERVREICFIGEVISKSRASGFIRGSKHLETRFSVFGNSNETLALVFELLLLPPNFLHIVPTKILFLY